MEQLTKNEVVMLDQFLSKIHFNQHTGFQVAEKDKGFSGTVMNNNNNLFCVERNDVLIKIEVRN